LGFTINIVHGVDTSVLRSPPKAKRVLLLDSLVDIDSTSWAITSPLDSAASARISAVSEVLGPVGSSEQATANRAAVARRAYWRMKSPM
jgi:hypothetical protein